MNKKVRIILITITLILGILLINQMKYRNDELYAVNLRNKIDKDLVSILVSDGDGNYTKYEDTTFPSNTEYTYNSELSKCQDSNGNVINGILSYNETTGKISIRTKKTTYCYLYFDKIPSEPLVDKVIASGELWQSGLEGDGYRYTGSGNIGANTTPNNFICFGTSNLSECKANVEKYMYRIIGVFPNEYGEEHLKLIKYKQLPGIYMWHSDGNTDISWEESDLYKGLNGINGEIYNDLFIGNTAYDYLQNNKWLNKIVDWKWTATNTLSCGEDGSCDETMSGPDYFSITTEQMYLHEMNKTKSTEVCVSDTWTYGTCDFNIGNWTYPIAKIGLMYASDYQLSLGSSSLTMTAYDRDTLKTGWLHQSNNDTTAATYEWLISRMGGLNGGNDYLVWDVDDAGSVYADRAPNEFGIRPVFYLDSTVTAIDGNGEYGTPYLIKE